MRGVYDVVLMGIAITMAMAVMCYALGCTNWERQQTVWSEVIERTHETCD